MVADRQGLRRDEPHRARLRTARSSSKSSCASFRTSRSWSCRTAPRAYPMPAIPIACRRCSLATIRRISTTPAARSRPATACAGAAAPSNSLKPAARPLRRLIVEEPVARAARWSRRLAVFALAIAGVAIALARMHAADPPAALTVFAAALVIAAIAVVLAGSAAVDDLARRAPGRGTGRVRLRPRRGADRLSRLSRRRRFRPAADQRGLDRPRLAAAVHALDQGARGARRGRAAAVERRDARRAARRPIPTSRR